MGRSHTPTPIVYVAVRLPKGTVDTIDELVQRGARRSRADFVAVATYLEVERLTGGGR